MAITHHIQPEFILQKNVKRQGFLFWKNLRMAGFLLPHASRGPWKSWSRSTEGQLRSRGIPGSFVCLSCPVSPADFNVVGLCYRHFPMTLLASHFLRLQRISCASFLSL